jgi:hypothetical protein
MKRALFGLLLSVTSLWSYIDSDIDGVEDADDRCPQTPLSDLVDRDGCAIQSTGKRLQYDIIVGGGYSQINYASQESADTMTSLLQADVYAGKWWLQGSTSYYRSSIGNTTESGWEDTQITLYYQFTPNEKLTLYSGLGIVLPTYRSGYANEAADYAVSVDFRYALTTNTTLFGSYSHTWVNDSDTPEMAYQNTQAFRLGGGYILSPKSSFTLSYNQTDSIYATTESIRGIGLGYFYEMDPHWFMTGDYGYGLSDSASDHTLSARVGYCF